jgi:hypothetical protein
MRILIWHDDTVPKNMKFKFYSQIIEYVISVKNQWISGHPSAILCQFMCYLIAFESFIWQSGHDLNFAINLIVE